MPRADLKAPKVFSSCHEVSRPAGPLRRGYPGQAVHSVGYQYMCFFYALWRQSLNEPMTFDLQWGSEIQGAQYDLIRRMKKTFGGEANLIL